MFITQCENNLDMPILGSANTYIDKDVKRLSTVIKRFFEYRILHCSDYTHRVVIYQLNECDIYNESRWERVDNFLVDKSKILTKGGK